MPHPVARPIQHKAPGSPRELIQRMNHPQPVPKDEPIKVRATQLGYYDHVRRREGDVFTIANRQAFSEKWMEEVDPDTRERITTAPQALRIEHDRILAEKMAENSAGRSAADDVLGE